MAYPVTIICDRYDGSYSGGAWLAFNLFESNIPNEIGGGDVEEEDFFKDGGNHENYKIGKGGTPDEALQDLLNKLSQ